MTKHIVATLSAVFCTALSLSAADLTVAAGDEQTISEDATYDTVTVYGKLTVSKGKKLMAGDMRVMPSGYLRLNGSSTSFSSVNASGDGSIIDQEESSSTHATVNVTGDGNSKMTQLGTAYTILNKSGRGTLTLAPRNAMHSLSVSDYLYRKLIKDWEPAIEKGVFCFAGEFGAWKMTPHHVVLDLFEDYLALWKERNMGWALWELRGGYGVLDSNRPDVEYEDFRGHKLDRKMLELLQRY